jgi:creatinine amidohydrolase
MHWQELTSEELAVAAGAGAVVVIAVGATEQHGPHLPVGTDSMCAQALAGQAAELAAASGVTVVVAPPVWVGYSRDHDGFPGTLGIGHRTLSLLLVDLGRGVLASGFSRLLYLNGHGGNDRLLYYVLRDVQDSAGVPSALAAVSYWRLAADALAATRETGPGGMAHACELETSLMLHHHPSLVRMERATDERAAEYSRFRRHDLLAPGPVMAPDRFADLTGSGVVGDPTLANGAKGADWSAAIATAVAELLADMTRWPLTGQEAHA